MPKTDRQTFAKIMAYIAAGLQKTLTDGGVEVYYDLLGDLPPDALQIAAKRAVLEHKYATFPTVAMIRDFATEAMRPDVLPAHEAWKLAYAAACDIDPENDANYRDRTGRVWDNYTEFRMGTLPAPVAEAVRRFGGLKLLANTGGKFAREPFLRAYGEIVSGLHAERILPAPIRQAILAISPAVALAGKLEAQNTEDNP